MGLDAVVKRYAFTFHPHIPVVSAGIILLLLFLFLFLFLTIQSARHPNSQHPPLGPLISPFPRVGGVLWLRGPVPRVVQGHILGLHARLPRRAEHRVQPVLQECDAKRRDPRPPRLQLRLLRRRAEPVDVGFHSARVRLHESRSLGG